MPIGTIYFWFGSQRRSLSVDTKEEAVAKISQVLQDNCVYEDQPNPYTNAPNVNLFANPTQIELSGLGQNDATWIAKQLASIKVGY